MSGSVEGPAFRYGAPAAVVDPLLSFLFDLRRMEACVLSALEHLGVQRQCLPPPFGESVECGSEKPQSHHCGAGKKEHVAATSTTASSSSINTLPHDATTTDTAAADVTAVPVSALDAYVASCLSCSAPPPPAASAAAIEHMLEWLDQQPPATQLPVSSSSTSHSLSPAARSLLVAFVAAAGEGREAVLVDVESGAEAVQQRVSAKRRKTEKEKEETSRTTQSADERHKVATLSAAEVQTTAEQCRRYEKLLKSGARELAATLSAVTTSDLAASYSCHAKWVEVAPEDRKVRLVLPSSAVVRTNYERLIAFSDAFATCQAAVHSAYVALEEAADTLLEEAVVVNEAERAFQRCVAQAQEECAALHDLRRRLKRTRETLERATALDA